MLSEHEKIIEELKREIGILQNSDDAHLVMLEQELIREREAHEATAIELGRAESQAERYRGVLEEVWQVLGAFLRK